MTVAPQGLPLVQVRVTPVAGLAGVVVVAESVAAVLPTPVGQTQVSPVVVSAVPVQRPWKAASATPKTRRIHASTIARFDSFGAISEVTWMRKRMRE